MNHCLATLDRLIKNSLQRTVRDRVIGVLHDSRPHLTQNLSDDLSIGIQFDGRC